MPPRPSVSFSPVCSVFCGCCQPCATCGAKPGALNFVALAADPLVDESGNPRTGYKFRHRNRIARHQRPPGKQQRGPDRATAAAHPRRIAARPEPWPGHPASELPRQRDPHGTGAAGRAATGRRKWQGRPAAQRPVVALAATRRAPPGGLQRLPQRRQRYGRQFGPRPVLSGIPAAIGMQGDFPYHLSDDLAATLYDFLLQGYPLGEAVRQARLAMVPQPYAVGLPRGLHRAGW